LSGEPFENGNKALNERKDGIDPLGVLGCSSTPPALLRLAASDIEGERLNRLMAGETLRVLDVLGIFGAGPSPKLLAMDARRGVGASATGGGGRATAGRDVATLEVSMSPMVFGAFNTLVGPWDLEVRVRAKAGGGTGSETEKTKATARHTAEVCVALMLPLFVLTFYTFARSA
jgi:hypothetical protein